jgi:hypothetical protein
VRTPFKLVSRLVAAWTAAAIASTGVPEASADPFELDPEVVAAQLFAAQVQARDGGQAGLRRLALSAAFVEWRRINPQASALEAADQLEGSRERLEAALRPVDVSLPDADYALKLASLLVAQQPASGAASSPHLRALVGGILGRSVSSFDTREDVVNGSLRAAGWLGASGGVESGVWTDVRSRALSDAGFAYAWNAALGQAMQVDATAPLAALAADPVIAQHVDLGLLLAQPSPAALLAEIRRQFQQVTAALAHESQQARARLEQLSAVCPVATQLPACTPAVRDAASTSAQAEQEMADALAAAGKFFGNLAKLVYPAIGDAIVKNATAWWSLFTAINKYIDAVSNRSLSNVALAGASFALAGNVLGVVMTLASLIGGSGPTVEQQILEQIGLLRQEVRALHQEMRASFQRIDAKIDLVFSAMMVQFDRLGQAIAGNTAALIDVQNQLAQQDMRLESVAASILTAIGDVELHDARAYVNQYIGYADTYGQPIPSYGEYIDPESEFHYAATDIAAHGAFVVPPSLVFDPGVRPDEVLHNFRESAAFSYLTRLAAARDPRIPDVDSVYPNPSVWNFAAQAYALLALQNPAYASQVSSARGAEIALEGDRILARAASFSRPTTDYDPTNPIFKGLLTDYRAALSRLGGRMRTRRIQDVQVRSEFSSVPGAPVKHEKQYDLFGPPAQVLPVPLLPADHPYVPKCQPGDGPPLSLTRPSNVSFKVLSPEILFAHYAFSPTLSPTDALPQLANCWEAEYVDEREVTNNNYYAVYARIRLSIHTRFRWSKVPDPSGPDDEWLVVRTAKHTWPETRVHYECYQHCPPNPPEPFVLEEWLEDKWPHDKPKFQSLASITVPGAPAAAARTRMNAFLWGRQRAYYQMVAAELAAPNQPLHLAVTDLDVASRQLQAFTRLGFPQALSADDILASLLFGQRSIPVDYPDNPHVTGTLGRAFTAYACSTPVAIGAPCAGGPFHPLVAQPHLDTSPFDPLAPCTAPTAGVAGLPGDPVGDCLVAGAVDRANLLAARYYHYSRMIADGRHVEELPWIASTRATLPLVNVLVAAEATE